ncbi:MAG: uroporphyrinogen-III C-methyltransferase [Spirosomataceae bacterium]
MKLLLIGAGPGDPELISLKGAKALAKAKVVLYDALVHPDLLDLCPENSLKIAVGKRGGKLSCKQDEINGLIAHYAREMGEVIRLKGGDPFVFGRGYEEIEYASNLGVACEVIPGISSALSVPALAGIPITLRGVSESFWVVTGTTKDHTLSNDVVLAAQSTATLVILMGVQKLPEIVEIFKEQGKAEEDIAIIQNGSLEEQKSVAGKIHNILRLAQEEKIGSPAVIVIGKVAKLMQKPQFLRPYLTSSTKLSR